MQAVILAAGCGVRLGAASWARSKALLPVGGRPHIAHPLDRLAGAGFWEAMIVTGRRDETIRDRLGATH